MTSGLPAENRSPIIPYAIDKGLPNPSDDFRKQYQITQITKDHNILMAKAREYWIEETILKVSNDKWKVARSDSGNVKSGVKSDVDQTFYIYELSPDGKTWVRNPELDGHFIKEFEKAWQMAHAVTLDQLDVASHEGKSTTTESSAETGNRLSCILSPFEVLEPWHKPKGMHWRTFWTLAARDACYHNTFLTALERLL
jgi:hypothetical protein